MITSAGLERAPYLVTVAPRVCNCRMPAKELKRARTLTTALSTVEGYWNVYCGFFGDQLIWLDFLVVDLRDGAIVWRNGRQIKEEEQGGTRQAEQRGRTGTGTVGDTGS